MKNYKVTCILLVVFFFTFDFMVAQDTNSAVKLKNEFLVSTSSLTLSNFSLKYYRSINQKLWYKLALINLSGSYHKTEPSSSSVAIYPTRDFYYSSGVAAGLEKRNYITDKFEMVIGLDLQMTYIYKNHFTDNPNILQELRDNKDITFTPGIGFVIGGYYHAGEHFSFGVEINPQVYYYYEKYNNANNTVHYKETGFNYSFSSNNASIGLKYVW